MRLKKHDSVASNMAPVDIFIHTMDLMFFIFFFPDLTFNLGKFNVEIYSILNNTGPR